MCLWLYYSGERKKELINVIQSMPLLFCTLSPCKFSPFCSKSLIIDFNWVFLCREICFLISAPFLIMCIYFSYLAVFTGTSRVMFNRNNDKVFAFFPNLVKILLWTFTDKWYIGIGILWLTFMKLRNLYFSPDLLE